MPHPGLLPTIIFSSTLSSFLLLALQQGFPNHIHIVTRRDLGY